MNTSRRSVIARIALAVGAAAAAATTLTGCVQFGSDDWAVTYEIVTDAAAPHELTAVAFDLEPDRGQPSELVEKGTLTTEPNSDGTMSLRIESVVAATERAFVTATPPAGVTATCRILLDDTREIATATSEPGTAVTCEMDTPAFAD